MDNTVPVYKELAERLRGIRNATEFHVHNFSFVKKEALQQNGNLH
ncbi:MAG: hypothetical protein R6V54_06255 [Desulfobacteraceae bacterium]